MAANHLAHFYLTGLLLPNLQSEGQLPRVLNLSSIAHIGVNPSKYYGDLFCEKKESIAKFDGIAQYGRSKLANIHFTKGLVNYDQDYASKHGKNSQCDFRL